MKKTLTCSLCRKERDVLSNGICNPCRLFRSRIDELVRDRLVDWVQQESDKLFAKMTDEEIADFSTSWKLHGPEYGFRLPKMILCTVLSGGIECLLGAESTKKHMKQVKKIYQTRY